VKTIVFIYDYSKVLLTKVFKTTLRYIYITQVKFNNYLQHTFIHILNPEP